VDLCRVVESQALQERFDQERHLRAGRTAHKMQFVDAEEEVGIPLGSGRDHSWERILRHQNLVRSWGGRLWKLDMLEDFERWAKIPYLDRVHFGFLRCV
jgi:hypothetical protein